MIEPAPTTGDAALAEQFVRNLIDNAVHHNVSGGHVRVAHRFRQSAPPRSPGRGGGLRERSFAMPEQLRAISHERLSKRLGTLRPKTLEELLKRCRMLLR